MHPTRVTLYAEQPLRYQVAIFRRLAQERTISMLVRFSRGVVGGVSGPSGHLLGGYEWEISSQPRHLQPFLVPRELRNDRPDVVMISMGYNDAKVLAIVGTSAVRRVPTVWRFEGNDMHKPRATVKRVVRDAALKTLYRQVSAFASIGKACTAHLLAHGVLPEQIFHSPYNLDDAYFAALCLGMTARRSALRRDYGIDEDTFVFLFSGKLEPYKNPRLLLRSFQRLRTKRKVVLFMAGKGALLSELEAMAAECPEKQVRFSGYLDHERLGQHFAVADAFVLPSRETWGRVVNEAFMFELPVIVSDHTGCHADLVFDHETGFVVPVDDEEALRVRMDELVEHREEARRMGKAARARVERYSSKMAAEGILAAFRYALQRGR